VPRASDSGERIEHGVDVGREGEPKVLIIVARIHDDREAVVSQAIESVGELCAAGLPRECDHAAHARIL